MELTFIGIIIFIFGLVWIRHFLKRKQCPPGPLGIPFLGVMLQQRNDQSLPTMINKMKNQYGDIFSFELGIQNFVVLNSYKIIREAQIEKADIFSARPSTPYFKKLNANHGIILNNGVKWKENRRFTLRILRNFGFGKSLLQENIIEEVEFVETLLTKNLGSPTVTTDAFVMGVSNIISILVFGFRWAYDDPKFMRYIKDVKFITQNEDFLIFLPMFYPALAQDWIIKRIPGCKQTFECNKRLHDVIELNFRQHRSSYDVKEEPRDLIEAYLQEQSRLADEKDSDMLKIFDDEQCIQVFYDLFIAGTDTTTNSLAWAMLNMALNPDIQEKVHKELDEFIGQDRRPQLTDRKSLHYCQAVLDEVARFSTVVPLGVEKAASQATQFHGSKISETDIILNNINAVHHDPKHWENPDEFYPAHFLNQHGEYKSSEYLIPFGVGKRSCLGESLAQMEFFLFFTCLMQRFNVKFYGDPTDSEAIKFILQGTDGVIRAPNPHELLFEKRDSKTD